MEEALRAGDVVGGGSGARDGFGAYGRANIVAGIVTPFSIIRIRIFIRTVHVHAVLAVKDPGRLTLQPVCERAVVVH